MLTIDNYDLETSDLAFVLTTHKHWDHAGGNSVLREWFPQVPFYGSWEDNADETDSFLFDGDQIQLGDVKIKALLTPCHTTGHTCFLMEGKSG